LFRHTQIYQQIIPENATNKNLEAAVKCIKSLFMSFYVPFVIFCTCFVLFCTYDWSKKITYIVNGQTYKSEMPDSAYKAKCRCMRCIVLFVISRLFCGFRYILEHNHTPFFSTSIIFAKNLKSILNSFFSYCWCIN
jgi:hypothetical protein